MTQEIDPDLLPASPRRWSGWRLPCRRCQTSDATKPSSGMPAARRWSPVAKVNRVEIGLLRGIDLTRDILLENTERFARGLPANNALLWGARGMGKSSLVKAAHHEVNASHGGRLAA